MQLIKGEQVVVVRDEKEHDELGEPVETAQTREVVSNVLVIPGATQELDATRPEGVMVSFTLCFPKTYRLSLRGCSVELRGGRYRVIGDPQFYTEENTPGAWNLAVEVERVDG